MHNPATGKGPSSHNTKPDVSGMEISSIPTWRAANVLISNTIYHSVLFLHWQDWEILENETYVIDITIQQYPVPVSFQVRKIILSCLLKLYTAIWLILASENMSGTDVFHFAWKHWGVGARFPTLSSLPYWLWKYALMRKYQKTNVARMLGHRIEDSCLACHPGEELMILSSEI